MLAVESVTKRFGGVTAVDGASLALEAGGIVGLIGPNGAGKTTLFSVISGFADPTSGRVLFEGQDITAEEPHRRAARGIGRTFQIVQPFAGLTVCENIAVGAYLRHVKRADAIARAREVARRVGLASDLDRPAGGLTVAGRKRLEVARALATRPVLLLLDEVLAGLRPTEVDRMVEVLRELNRSEGLTILMIEHVMRAVMALSDRVVVLDHGEKIADGAPSEVVSDPRVVQSYLGAEEHG